MFSNRQSPLFITPVVLNIMILCGLMYLLQMVLISRWPDPQEIAEWFALYKTNAFGIREALGHYPVPATLDHFRPVQLVTNIFSHSFNSFGHLFFNMLALFMFGSSVEDVIGSRRFLALFLFSGVVGSIFVVLFDPSILPGLGASTPLSGILLAYGLLFPNNTIIIFPIPLPIKVKYFLLFYISASLYSVVFDPYNLGTNVSHFAHLMGMLAGAIYIYKDRLLGIFKK